jgi:hypothetical protein
MEVEPLYTPLFCEENIWQLARSMLAGGAAPDALWVLFFSNPGKQVVMLNQRRAGVQDYVVWDYHVVLQAGERIYDLDTLLPCPVSATDYLLNSFPDQAALAEPYRALVRCIPAGAFVERFYSDRHHMRGVIAENEFPPWPAMMPQHDHAIALSDYWDMQKGLDDGSEVMSVAAYLRGLLGGAGWPL